MENPRILIIENQYTQLEQLHGALKSLNYEAFPDIGHDKETNDRNYREIMDEVRIILNGRYGNAKTGDAESNLLKCFKEIGAELFIVDYLLVGNDDGGNGFQIAELIRKEYTSPILFLSRTPVNSQKVYDGLNKIIQPRDWLHKGYNGQEILKPDFIKNQLDKKIKELMSKGKKNDIDDMISYICEEESLNEDFVRYFNEGEVSLIFSCLFNSTLLEEEDINIVADLYRKDKRTEYTVQRADIRAFGEHFLNRKKLRKPANA